MYLCYMDRDTATEDLPPGLRHSLSRIICCSPVLIYMDYRRKFVGADVHCHCNVKGVHCLMCLAWQGYVKTRAQQLYKDGSRSLC